MATDELSNKAKGKAQPKTKQNGSKANPAAAQGSDAESVAKGPEDLEPLSDSSDLSALDDVLGELESGAPGSSALDQIEEPAEPVTVPPSDATVAAPAAVEALEEDESPAAALRGGWSFGDMIRGLGACGISMVLHIVLLVVLGMLVFDNAIKAEVQTLVAAPAEEQRPEDEPVEIELNEEIETVTEQTMAVFSASPAVGATGPAAAVGSPTLDQRLVEQVEATEVMIEAPTIGIPDSVGLIEAVPDGEVKGEPRAIVGDYQQAMDRLAQEIVWMLDRGPVLAVWLFDQSESMKDDQREIRDRIDNVYNQLGIVGDSNSDALMTAVASYGEGFVVHTQKPTASREEIRKAIDAVPVDGSGKEMMCQAVGRAISLHKRFVGRNRQMALILVSDESGDPANNDRFLEAAIAEAKAAKCKVYTLGREAVFGYPHAYFRWEHPQTQRVHWLQIDRGPETAFPEQLQVDGFRRRHDAFSSGFGPYEQSRLARESNGIFFMLPSIEEDLVGKENKYKYDLESMRPFMPDMRARIEVLQDRDKHPLRTLIWKVISDLNPYNPASQKVVELQVRFELQPDEFIKAARENQVKAKLLLRYMADAQKALEDGKKLREQEAHPRWQANYDVIYAQLIAYQARIYEYGVGLDAFIKNLQEEAKKHPRQRSPTEVLLHWHVFTRKETLTEESKPYIEKASGLLKQAAEAYRGTPWGARAEWELNRGFGVYVHGEYGKPYKEVPNAIPVPKL